MKKALSIFVFLLIAPFSVSAATIYQQLSDSSGNIDLPVNTYDVIGLFTTPSTDFSFDGGTLYLFIHTDTNTTFTVEIGTSTNQVCNSSAFPSGNVPISVGGSVGISTLLAGPLLGSSCNQKNTTYYVWLKPANTPAHISTVSNLSSTFFFGYITDGAGNSIPIVPGIPGFTDAGISTSSQQVFCNSNFSTSSGLLGDLAQSISLAACNVGVFLFVPSSSALSQWQSLATTTKSKIPFSYATELYTDVSSLVATTTENIPTYVSDLHATGIGSTTPIGNVLPSFTFLSAATIGTYLPSGIHDALFLLARSAIWLGVIFMMYRRVTPHRVKV